MTYWRFSWIEWQWPLGPHNREFLHQLNNYQLFENDTVWWSQLKILSSQQSYSNKIFLASNVINSQRKPTFWELSVPIILCDSIPWMPPIYSLNCPVKHQWKSKFLSPPSHEYQFWAGIYGGHLRCQSYQVPDFQNIGFFWPLDMADSLRGFY